MKLLDLICLALLCFFVTASIAYQIDGGLKASHICLKEGENNNCFESMRLAK